MNLVVQDSVELMNKNDQGSTSGDNRLGTVLLRADNILIIAIEPSIWKLYKLIGMNAAYSDDGSDKIVTISKVNIGFKYETMIIT